MTDKVIYAWLFTRLEMLAGNLDLSSVWGCNSKLWFISKANIQTRSKSHPQYSTDSRNIWHLKTFAYTENATNITMKGPRAVPVKTGVAFSIVILKKSERRPGTIGGNSWNVTTQLISTNWHLACQHHMTYWHF